MRTSFKTVLVAAALINLNPHSTAFAEEVAEAPIQEAKAESESVKDRERVVMERVMVIGNAENVQDITGSAQFIDQQTLERNAYTDINRVLRQVPGVNLQEEEGYGNRPNIGLRGGRSDRSADITLMEDGVLIAPAPYAAPAAYYFPRVSRMEGVEVRKGSSTIKFGPRTTSGAVNMISTSIPSERSGRAVLGYGSDDTRRAQFRYGNTYGNFGYVLDFGHEATDGFKSVDIVGGDTGYSIQDGMGKFRIGTDPAAEIYQSLEFKIGATHENSRETYLGLTEEDFNEDPYRRYAGSQMDRMDADHRQYQLRHFADFGRFDVTTTLYHNQFGRNWYKVQNVVVGGVSRAIGPALESAAHLSAVKGETDLDGSAANNITIRANNRAYYSTGIQSDLGTRAQIGETDHKIEIGARYHYDKEDRFQHQDRYSITDGVMELAAAGAPGSQTNAHATAKAVALYVLDEIAYGDWTFVPGARFEHIDLRSENRNNGDAVSNTVTAFVPGLGVGYSFTDSLSAFGGVHKGFAPPSPGNAENDNEESINYELGLRYNRDVFSAELVGFYSDYSNLLGECTISSGCDAGTGEQFNAGEVDAHGIELSLGYDLAPALNVKEVSLPLNFNYTWTSAEFQNSFVSDFEEWGTVEEGDELPYIPEHQFYVSAGVVHPKWEIHLAGKYVDEMRTEAGKGSIPAGQGTDSHFIVDMAGEYEILDNTRLFLTADNITDQEYVAARRPAGARPGKPFTVLAGIKFEF